MRVRIGARLVNADACVRCPAGMVSPGGTYRDSCKTCKGNTMANADQSACGE